jgi:hypothetical protein
MLTDLLAFLMYCGGTEITLSCMFMEFNINVRKSPEADPLCGGTYKEYFRICIVLFVL